MIFALIAIFAAERLPAQQAAQFEVASVRPADRGADEPSFMRGGPGTADPGQITYQRQSLLRFISVAYGLDFDQISAPTWIASEYYTMVAKVPAGATKDQVKLMWQTLLAERFQMKAHMIKKEFPVYQLVLAKGGSKLRKSGDSPPPLERGFPEPPAGQSRAMSVVPPRTTRMTFRGYSMAEFAQQLGWPLSTFFEAWGAVALGRVVDKTGLDAHYDFTLEFAGRWNSPEGASPPPLPEGQVDTAPFLFDALRQQLGLVIKEGKAQLDVLVVDKVDRIPIEN